MMYCRFLKNEFLVSWRGFRIFDLRSDRVDILFYETLDAAPDYSQI